MSSTSPTNVLRELCAIEFRVTPQPGCLDLIGTINFNQPTVSNEGVIANFGILTCRLDVIMSSGQMPMRSQLIQKQLTIGAVGDGLKDVRNQTDHELTGEIEGKLKGLQPTLGVGASTKQTTSQVVSGKSHQPEYLIHINLCGDALHPAWTLKSTAIENPILGTLIEETFGQVVDFLESTEISVELRVPENGLWIDVKGDNSRRMKALQQLLTREMEYFLYHNGPIAKQMLASEAQS